MVARVPEREPPDPASNHECTPAGARETANCNQPWLDSAAPAGAVLVGGRFRWLAPPANLRASLRDAGEACHLRPATSGSTTGQSRLPWPYRQGGIPRHSETLVPRPQGIDGLPGDASRPGGIEDRFSPAQGGEETGGPSRMFGTRFPRTSRWSLPFRFGGDNLRVCLHRAPREDQDDLQLLRHEKTRARELGNANPGKAEPVGGVIHRHTALLLFEPSREPGERAVDGGRCRGAHANLWAICSSRISCTVSGTMTRPVCLKKRLISVSASPV